MSQRNTHRTVSGRWRHRRGTEGKGGPGEALRAGTGAEAGVENECTRRKRRGAESWSVLPHALVLFFQNYPWKQSSKPRKYHNQAAFVFILKKRKMAKERGLISPSDFAQLQKYMEYSTKKVSDVLKLFEDGEMAEYLQGDATGYEGF